MINKRNSLTKKYNPRQRRIFSKELKRKLVEEIEHKRLKVREVVSLYNVSKTNVYKWIKQYSSMNIPGVVMVVESQSKESKLESLFQRITDLEQMLGKKQMEIEFKDTVIEICSNELGYDVKKKCTTMQSNTIG